MSEQSPNLATGVENHLWSILTPKPKALIVLPEMAFHCFDVLLSYLRKTVPSMNVDFPATRHPLFVTWAKKNRQEEIQGCAGTIEPVLLRDGLNEFALLSALRETGLSGIGSEDVTELQVTVAVLDEFEQRKHFLDWTIGVHGIQLTFEGRDKGKRSATLLPEYPFRMGWTKVETIDELMRRTGFIGKITGEDRKALKITRFQTQKVTRSYDDYNQFRNWKTRNPPEKYYKTSAVSIAKAHF